MALQEMLTSELAVESKMTRKILERVPLDQKDWKPHPKSMSIGRLATHIAEIPHWVSAILTTDIFDFAQRKNQPHVVASQAELLGIFDENIRTAMIELAKADTASFDNIWTVKRGEHIVVQLPKKDAIRSWGFSHVFHHRGQLTVFLRLLDIAVPGMYGPSADEQR